MPIRKEDFENFRRLVEYLEDLGLKVELRGSVLTKTDYEDIDLYVEGHPDQIAGAISGLKGYTHERMGKRIVSFREKYNPENYEIKQIFPECEFHGFLSGVVYSVSPMTYVDENIDYRFKIKIGDSLFDVSFKPNPRIIALHWMDE